MGIGLGSKPDIVVNATTSENGLVKFISNEELDRIEEERIMANRPIKETGPVDDLATHVRDFFDVAKSARQDVEDKMLAILRQIKGEYEPDKLAAIQELGGSDDFIRLSQHKVRDAEAWIIDIINPHGDSTWDIEPTPIAELPEDITNEVRSRIRRKMVSEATSQSTIQGTPFNTEFLESQMADIEDKIVRKVKKKVQDMAKRKAKNMKLKIADQLEESGWNEAFRACINDLSRLKSCIMKGPVFKKVPTLRWEQDDEGEYKAITSVEAVPVFSRVSPFDWYPAPRSRNAQHGDAIEMEHLEASDLTKMIGVPGYRDDVIREILEMHPEGFEENSSMESERRDLEQDNTEPASKVQKTYDMLNFWGLVKGSMLIKFGTKKNGEDPIQPNEYYSVNIKTIDDKVIKDPVFNPDPLCHKPYGVTSFVKTNDSQWGECPPELMTDIQSICNATVRALVNNIAISSGPVTEIDVGRLAPGESGELWPHKRILTTNKRMQEGHAIQFYQAQILANELLLVYEKFKREADDLVVPAYGRTNIGGAGRTSSGLAMLMSAAARNIKLAILNVDSDIIIPAIMRLFNFNMLFLDDDSIKGDIRVKARGTTGVVAKEQISVRRNEFRASLRPTDEELMGQAGLAYVLRKNIESLDMDVDKAMPNFPDIEAGDEIPGLFDKNNRGGSAPSPQTLDVAGQQAGGPDETSLFRETPE